MSINPYLIDFYNTYDEDRRLALKHGSVEFLTTMRYINKYIRPGHRVLEIGAGTGRYSHALARQGYSVDAVELVQHNMDVFREKTLPEENITIRRGMLWICQHFQMINTISHCCWGPSIIFTVKKIKNRQSVKPSG